MSSTQASHPDNLRTRQATRNSFARSPLRYNQANDLSKQLKRAAESRNAKSRNASPDRKPKPGSPRKRTQTQPPVTSNSNDRKQSEGKKDGVGIVAEGEDNKSEEKLTQQEPEEAENTQLEEDELYSLKKEVKTPAFVKRHPDKFCIDDMGRGTRQQFVLIATAYNTDHTRKQIVDKYRRLMDNSTPMKKLMHKDQNEDLEKYKRWLDGEQRYVGFGSQLDLRKNQYVAEKTNREKEKTDTTAGTEN